MTPQFQIGQRVSRVEARTSTGAVVREVGLVDDQPNYRIAYDEGGEGWWPESALRAA